MRGVIILNFEVNFWAGGSEFLLFFIFITRLFPTQKNIFDIFNELRRIIFVYSCLTPFWCITLIYLPDMHFFFLAIVCRNRNKKILFFLYTYAHDNIINLKWNTKRNRNQIFFLFWISHFLVVVAHWRLLLPPYFFIFFYHLFS